MTFVSLFLFPWMLTAAVAQAETGELPRVIKRADGAPAGGASSSAMTQDESNAVFKLDSGPAPKTSRSLTDPNKERAVGPEPELNSAVREAILRRCEPLRDRSMEQFRACFEREKQAELDRVQRSFDRTSRGDAFRTAPR
jgi:hypothetical protein